MTQVIMPTPSDISSVSALLNLISNPKVAKDNLEALSNQASDFSKQMDDIREQHRQLDAKKAEVVKAQSDLSTQQESINTQKEQLDNKAGSIGMREAAVSERERQVEVSEGVLGTKLQDHASKALTLAQKEKDLLSQSTILDQSEKEIEQLKKTYEDKISRLKEII